MDERLNEINRELKELNEALARQGRMEAQWKDLQDQRAERDRRVMETGRVFRKEQDDVDRLEKGGLRALLLSLTGDREVRLSKERREALAAKLQYDQAQRDLEDLDGRIGVLLREKDGLRIDRIRRDALLEEKGELLKALGGETGARLARLDQQLDELEHQRREVGEAISAGRTAESALSAVLNSLDSAEDWGTWDMLGGGLLTTMAKHGHLDDAQAGIGWAQQCLSRFRTELADVRDMELPRVVRGRPVGCERVVQGCVHFLVRSRVLSDDFQNLSPYVSSGMRGRNQLGCIDSIHDAAGQAPYGIFLLRALDAGHADVKTDPRLLQTLGGDDTTVVRQLHGQLHAAGLENGRFCVAIPAFIKEELHDVEGFGVLHQALILEHMGIGFFDCDFHGPHLLTE